ncbi:hypothetical protein AMAG_03073 [Allomyces macrogynus ATCC 38327]|uniref:G-protein coupled receptors family 1 profile domain-containing protein n=1 Tax=Allomyces macrogynus (strain ATCC 38327) TaxID=578462 RepID=A0A0L0S483_ALLM3|nr:hypothetical protein AMAG_03073 [Allomyces macrogynus ATCC 38327]|eukprot:KNE57353.1 hypothetical protein AMAG_03073 [Allomyces macrogynus ATCC 38327]
MTSNSTQSLPLWVQVEVATYGSSDAAATMAICLLTSVVIGVYCVRAMLASKAVWYHAGIALTTLPLFINNVAYFAVIFGTPLAMNVYEVLQVVSPVMTSVFVFCLTLERFKVFSVSGLARWFTPRVQTRMVAFTTTLLFVGLALIAWSYMGTLTMTDPIPTSIFRQRIMTFVVGTCSIGDLAITVIIFRLVLRIRSQVLVPSNDHYMPPSGRNSLTPLPPTAASKAELVAASVPSSTPSLPARQAMTRSPLTTSRALRANPRAQQLVRRLLVSLVTMFVLMVVGILIFPFATIYLENCIAYLTVHLYILVSMIQWVYTVDLVNLRRSSTTGNTSGPSHGAKQQHRGSRGHS